MQGEDTSKIQCMEQPYAKDQGGWFSTVKYGAEGCEDQMTTAYKVGLCLIWCKIILAVCVAILFIVAIVRHTCVPETVVEGDEGEQDVDSAASIHCARPTVLILAAVLLCCCALCLWRYRESHILQTIVTLRAVTR